MAMHYIIITIAVTLILAFQVVSLLGTWKRMRLFSKIFGGEKSYNYELLSDPTSERINGFSVIGGADNNPFFSRIKESINKYITHNEAIDFQLLKDTVDRNCDSIEEDIHTQIPIPLYLGLAGTMLGIIVGIGYLWLSGALDALLSVTPLSTGNNTEGIVVLLGSVAIAMICSIVGLIMTTFCTYKFKGCKLSIEERKSDLYAWMQQHLLPEVATDDLQAISKISRSLISFNSTFKKHSETFAQTLQSVQTILDQQQSLARTVAQMGCDATEMARVNAIATQRLEQSAEKIDHFNDYLDSINGYVNEVHHFTTLFKDETLRLKALEEIRDFFLSQNKEIAARNEAMSKQVGELDHAFVKAMQDLRESMNNENKELKKIVGQRTVAFEDALNEQKELFVNVNKEIITDFERQLKQLPQAVVALNGLQSLPEQVGHLIDKVDKSNGDLVKELRKALPAVLFEGGKGGKDKYDEKESVTYMQSTPMEIPLWMKWSIGIGTAFVSVAAVLYIVLTLIPIIKSLI